MSAVTVIDGAVTVGAPSSGDDLYVLGGNAAIVTAVDQSALANGLAIVEVGKAYTGQFATAGNPFYTEVTTRLVYAAAAGDMYFRCKTAGDSTPLIYGIGGGHLHCVTGGVATRYDVLSGQHTISGPFTVTNLRIAGGNTLLLDDTSTDPTLLAMYAGPSGVGGSCYTERGGTTFTIEVGVLTINAGSNTITTLNCTGSPTSARTILKASGTITTVNASGHIPDTSQLTSPLIITNTNVNCSLPGAQAFLDHPLITFTNTPARWITDGRIV